MILIADTEPLIALAKIKHLDLLHVLFEQVRIPSIVYKELTTSNSVHQYL
jgi:predicted nucleic acid-binding protein